MDLLTLYKQNWKVQFRHFTPNNCHLIIAVSGGIDSVVLTDLVFKAGFNFTIAHCNFKLRGAASDSDEQFVQSLGVKYGKQVLVKHFDTQAYADNNKVSIQVAARELRYSWFEEVVSRELLVVNNQPTHHSPFTIRLLTAHHADDNIETVLMNIFRGTGISGLHGILPIQNNIIRSLLFAKKTDLMAYAQEHQLAWVEDASNASDDYTRNFFRHQIIPKIKEVFPNADDILLANIDRWTEAEQLYNQQIQTIKLQLLEHKGNEIHIPVLKLKKQKPLSTIIFEIIKTYDFTAAQVKDVLQLIDSANGKFVASATHRVIKNRNWLIIAPVVSTLASNILIEANIGFIAFEDGSLEICVTNKVDAVSELSHIAQLDAATIQFPLLLRKWKMGDYFYPLGMQKKKKISRFLIDKKLSATDKEKIWVLESNQRIIWVLGQRIDNRFKITPSTKEMVQIKFV